LNSIKFVIITHVSHFYKNDEYFAYSPYVQEMNIWLKYVDETIIVAPLKKLEITPIDISYKHDRGINFKTVPDFNFISSKDILVSIFKLPVIFWRIFWAMKAADHIHLRCPGNMGLIGCFVQILFPNKIKTAKYAGNWDPKSKQPWSYRLQKWILNNEFLTRNMQVLVYGEWEKQSKNVKSFFTATYSELEKYNVEKRFDDGFKIIFVGSLVSGKNPLYGIKLVEKLLLGGYHVTLDLYGEGVERDFLENYIQTHKLEEYIILKGNQNKEALIKAYQKSHFVILPSKSEGWPKAIAEGMFWGCIPIATKVSSVPYMLDFGKRGVLLEMDLDKDTEQVKDLIMKQSAFLEKSQIAIEWSRNFTTDVFEKEIAKLLQK